MEFILCHSHFVMLPGRNRSYCLGTAAVLGNPMSPVRLESICWLAQSGQTVLCAPEYQSENILNTIFKKCLIPFDSFCIWNVSIIYKTSDVKKEKKKSRWKPQHLCEELVLMVWQHPISDHVPGGHLLSCFPYTLASFILILEQMETNLFWKGSTFTRGTPPGRLPYRLQ